MSVEEMKEVEYTGKKFYNMLLFIQKSEVTSLNQY